MSTSPPRRPVILVADDDRDILDLVTFLFERAGFDVLSAADGEQAVELARTRTPDCAILDVMMPKLSGIEVMHRLHDTEATRSVPVILLTALTRERDVVSGLEEGAAEYIRKPFSTLELLARVRALLRSHESRERPAADGARGTAG